MILDEIMNYRREQLNREMEKITPDEMKFMALNCSRTPIDFKAAISKNGINIIAEVKKASPSKGVISHDFHPTQTAVNYEKSGAAAISVLTEEHYFMGSSDYLKEIRKNVSLPLLRKDFIFDPYQIYEAKAIGADAVLLIAALLGEEEMKKLRLLAQSLGLSVLCESHTASEIQTCIDSGADIFGINNRNLKTFNVDLATTADLAKLLPKDSVVVSESGMFNADDILRAKSYGANAVLVGESLMRSPGLLSEIREKIQ